jgi:hypothetical protein
MVPLNVAIILCGPVFLACLALLTTVANSRRKVLQEERPGNLRPVIGSAGAPQAHCDALIKVISEHMDSTWMHRNLVFLLRGIDIVFGLGCVALCLTLIAFHLQWNIEAVSKAISEALPTQLQSVNLIPVIASKLTLTPNAASEVAIVIGAVNLTVAGCLACLNDFISEFLCILIPTKTSN